MRDPAGVLTVLYHDAEGLLFAMERGGSTYYVATDQVGTPQVVADAAGAVLKVLDYDSFGVLITDSNPGFDLPIGFAGAPSDIGKIAIFLASEDSRYIVGQTIIADGGQQEAMSFGNAFKRPLGFTWGKDYTS